MDSAELAKVQVDSYRISYAQLLPPAYLAHFTYDEQEKDWFNLLSSQMENLLLVAENTSRKIVGYAYGGLNVDETIQFDAELIALHVRKAAQKQGVGTYLFAAICTEFRKLACKSICLKVLEENTARRFYEKRGGKLLYRKTWQNNTYFGTDILEVAYGWQDLQSIIDFSTSLRSN